MEKALHKILFEGTIEEYKISFNTQEKNKHEKFSKPLLLVVHSIVYKGKQIFLFSIESKKSFSIDSDEINSVTIDGKEYGV